MSYLSPRGILVLALLCSPAFASDTLFHQSVNTPNPGGKDLIMSFDEIARDDKTSTIKVVMTSGASVPSAMFIVKGVYTLARLRGKAFFIKLKEWRADDHSTMMRVGFSDNGTEDPTTYFSLSEPLSAKDGNAFEPVARFDGLFTP